MDKMTQLDYLESFLPRLQADVPEEVSARILEQLRHGVTAEAGGASPEVPTKRGQVRRPAFRRPSILVGAAVVVMMILFTLPFTPAAQAIQNNMLTQTLLHWLRGTPAEPWVKKVNDPVTNHGVTMTVTDVLYDQNKIELSYTVVFSNPAQATESGGVAFDKSSLQLSGHRVEGTISATQSAIAGGFNGVITIVPNATLQKAGTLQVVFTRIGQTHGRWAFRIPVSTVKMDTAAKTFKPDTVHLFGREKVIVKQVQITPATTEVDYEVTGPSSGFWPIYFDLASENGQRWKAVSGSLVGKPVVSNGVTTEHFKGIYQTRDVNPTALQLIPWNPSHTFKSGDVIVVKLK